MNTTQPFHRIINILIAAASTLVATAAPAQPATPRQGVVSDGGGRRFGLSSPVVHDDRTVTFRLSAPQADTVTLTSDFLDETPLTQSDDGTWSVTVGPVNPDIYYYNFVVNGVRTIDPGNSHAKIGYYTSTTNSILTVPGHVSAFYDTKDVPHGEIRTHIYKSKSNNVTRELNVYLPPGYDQDTDKHYPVLYLLHGNANDHHSWQRYGRANEILDNLLADSMMEPFIVVMPLGYGLASINGDGTGIANNAGPDNRPASAASPDRNTSNNLYERDIIEDAIPLIDSKYRTITDRRSRAIFGFSMGGGQSAHIGLRNLDAFSRIGIMSAGLRINPNAEPYASLAADIESTNNNIDLLWIACGRDDFAFPGASSASQTLTELGIDHTFVETEGGHHWRVWRRYLHDVAPQIFSSSAK